MWLIYQTNSSSRTFAGKVELDKQVSSRCELSLHQQGYIKVPCTNTKKTMKDKGTVQHLHTDKYYTWVCFSIMHSDNLENKLCCNDRWAKLTVAHGLEARWLGSDNNLQYNNKYKTVNRKCVESFFYFCFIPTSIYRPKTYSCEFV